MVREWVASGFGAKLALPASPLAKDDSEVVRGHVVSLLQLESFGSREKRDILQAFRVLGLEQLVEGFVARRVVPSLPVGAIEKQYAAGSNDVAGAA